MIFSPPATISGGRAVIDYFRMLTRPQLHAYLAALGGWSLDALDFFVFVFCFCFNSVLCFSCVFVIVVFSLFCV